MRTVKVTLAFLVLVPAVLYAQDAIAAAAPTGALTAPPGQWQTSLVVSYFTTTAWEWFKKKDWVYFKHARARAIGQRTAGVIVAAISAAGLTWTFDPVAGRLVIEGLTPAALIGLLKDTGWQYAANEIIYRGHVKPKPVVAIVNRDAGVPWHGEGF